MTGSPAARVLAWTALAGSPPQRGGYFKVRDETGRVGVAFRHRNHTWTAISGSVRKPYRDWCDIV